MGDIVVWGDAANSMRGHSRVPVGVPLWGHYSVWGHGGVPVGTEVWQGP